MKPTIPEGLTPRFQHKDLPARRPVVPGPRKFDEYRTKSVETIYRYVLRGTVCQLLDENGEVIAVGEARCCPKDQFNRRLGRTISLGRALKQYRKTT